MTAEVGVRPVQPPSEPVEPPISYFSGGISPLMNACQQGKEQQVRQILHQVPGSVRERDRTGKTALHYCAENPTFACIDQVVSADGTLLQARDEDGYTPLHLATIAGNKVIVKYLLERGADIHARDNEKHTAVHWATVCGEVELLDLLIDHGADASTPDIHGAYPIHYAAQMCGPNSELGNDVGVGLKVLRKLLERGVDVSVTDHDGREPLLWAASAEMRASHVYCPSGSPDAILALVNAGANVSDEDKDGLTALHCAASRGHLECLDVLITLCGAEVDTLDSNGCTPLFYSVTLGHADCTELLLKHGSHPDRQDRKGRTPAHCGAAKGQLETLKLLHRREADLWKKNVKGDLPLHEACQSGRKDLVTWLLSMSPETVNAPNHDGRTPLHIAAINNNIEMCKVLMDHNANVNPIMRNSRGQLLTPVDAAVARGNRGCAKYLQLHGGTPAAKITDKRALQLAMQRALENGPTGPTGATPSDLTGDEFLSSSASTLLKSQGSTIAAVSPVDMEVQTDAEETKPDMRDAQTFTSEVNIREYLLKTPGEDDENQHHGEQSQDDISGKMMDASTNTASSTHAEISIQTSIDKNFGKMSKDVSEEEEANKSDNTKDSTRTDEAPSSETNEKGESEDEKSSSGSQINEETNNKKKDKKKLKKKTDSKSSESKTDDEKKGEKEDLGNSAEIEEDQLRRKSKTDDEKVIEKITGGSPDVNEEDSESEEGNEGDEESNSDSGGSSETFSNEDGNKIDDSERDVKKDHKIEKTSKKHRKIKQKSSDTGDVSGEREEGDGASESRGSDTENESEDNEEELDENEGRSKTLSKNIHKKEKIKGKQKKKKLVKSQNVEDSEAKSSNSDDSAHSEESESNNGDATEENNSNSKLRRPSTVTIRKDIVESQETNETIAIGGVTADRLVVHDSETENSSKKRRGKPKKSRKSTKDNKEYAAKREKSTMKKDNKISDKEYALKEEQYGNDFPKADENDIRTHELMLRSSARDYLMVQDAPMPPGSPSSLYSREAADSGYKESGYSDTMVADQDTGGDATDTERNTDEEDPLRIGGKRTKVRRRRTKKGNGSTENEEGQGDEEDQTEDANGNDGKGVRKRRILRSKISNRLDEEGEQGVENEYDEDGNLDEEGLPRDPNYRRAGERKGQIKNGAMSGGPKKVEDIDTSLKKRSRINTNIPSEVSITQAMQTTMRKYSLERKLFQQLLDLKRQQIRNTRANEHVMIKRMVDGFNKEGSLLGMRGYGGPFTFNGYEKFLYDSLRFLQSSHQGTKIPQFRPTDDIEKLSKALRRSEILELPPNPYDSPREAVDCNHSTHRCHHAVHAYTGVPCAAYLGHSKKKPSVGRGKVSLPRIPGGDRNGPGKNGAATGSNKNGLGSGKSDSSPHEPVGLKNYDPKKPFTVQLEHGEAKQQITLPTELLDKKKKYQLTFTIKSSDKENQGEGKEETVELEPPRSAPEGSGSVEDKETEKPVNSAPLPGRKKQPVK